MDFFKSQESLTATGWILRSIVGFVFLIVAADRCCQIHGPAFHFQPN